MLEVQPPAQCRVGYEVNLCFIIYTVIFNNLKSAAHCTQYYLTKKETSSLRGIQREKALLYNEEPEYVNEHHTWNEKHSSVTVQIKTWTRGDPLKSLSTLSATNLLQGCPWGPASPGPNMDAREPKQQHKMHFSRACLFTVREQSLCTAALTHPTKPPTQGARSFPSGMNCHVPFGKSGCFKECSFTQTSKFSTVDQLA